MKRKTLMVLAAAAGLAFSMVTMSQGAESKAPAPAACEFGNKVEFPLQVTFRKPAALKTTHFGAIKFNHGQHFNVACVTCHHTWDGKSQVQGCSAEGCHDNFTGQDGAMSYFNAFHARDAEQSCVGCHKRKLAEGSKKIKTMPCHNNSCHVLQTASK